MASKIESKMVTLENSGILKVYTIKSGTILYRGDKTESLNDEKKTGILQSTKCRDTKKTGKYFGTHPIFATSISVERKKQISVGHFIVTEDIKCYIGKYCFRYINPQKRRGLGRYIIYEEELRGEEENVNHFDHEPLPIIDKEFDKIIEKVQRGECDNEGSYGEVFITSLDLHKIKLAEIYDLPQHEIVLQKIKETKYSFSSKWYIP